MIDCERSSRDVVDRDHVYARCSHGGIAVAGSFPGVCLSFFMDSAPTPTIVLQLSIAFIHASGSDGGSAGLAPKKPQERRRSRYICISIDTI